MVFFMCVIGINRFFTVWLKIIFVHHYTRAKQATGALGIQWVTYFSWDIKFKSNNKSSHLKNDSEQGCCAVKETAVVYISTFYSLNIL